MPTASPQSFVPHLLAPGVWATGKGCTHPLERLGRLALKEQLHQGPPPQPQCCHSIPSRVLGTGDCHRESAPSVAGTWLAGHPRSTGIGGMVDPLPPEPQRAEAVALVLASDKSTVSSPLAHHWPHQ